MTYKRQHLIRRLLMVSEGESKAIMVREHGCRQARPALQQELSAYV